LGKLADMIKTRSRTRLLGRSQEIARFPPSIHSLARRNPVPREEFIQPALVNTRQRVQPMNAGNYLFRFDVVQSTGRDDEGWVAKLPCQTQTGSVHIPESEVEAQSTSAEMLPRFWRVLRHSHAIALYRMRVDAGIALAVPPGGTQELFTKFGTEPKFD